MKGATGEGDEVGIGARRVGVRDKLGVVGGPGRVGVGETLETLTEQALKRQANRSKNLIAFIC